MPKIKSASIRVLCPEKILLQGKRLALTQRKGNPELFGEALRLGLEQLKLKSKPSVNRE